MQNLEDADVVEETSVPGPNEQDQHFKIVDLLTPERTMETEVEMLGFRPDRLDTPASPNQISVVGKAIISSSSSRHWKASIELMQANTKDRLYNMQIFTELLRRIRSICLERCIEHLTMVDIGGVSHEWYRDFFRLAGFSHCRCQSSASRAVQLETRNCVVLRKSLAQDVSSRDERIRTWLAEISCTKEFCDPFAPRKGAEMERRYFHDLQAGLKDGDHSQVAELRAKLVTENQMLSKRARRDSMNSLAARRKVLKPKTKTVLLAKRSSGKDAVAERIGSSANKVVKKRKRS